MQLVRAGKNLLFNLHKNFILLLIDRVYLKRAEYFDDEEHKICLPAFCGAVEVTVE